MSQLGGIHTNDEAVSQHDRQLDVISDIVAQQEGRDDDTREQIEAPVSREIVEGYLRVERDLMAAENETANVDTDSPLRINAIVPNWPETPPSEPAVARGLVATPRSRLVARPHSERLYADTTRRSP